MAHANWLPDDPAFKGIHPHELDWQLIGNVEEAKAYFDNPLMSQWIDVQYPFIKSISKLDTYHNKPFGFYRFTGLGIDHFIKIVSTEQANRQSKANQVSKWLQVKGVDVSSLEAGYPIKISEEFSLLAYQYLSGAFCTPCESDLKLVGRAIARLHLGLESYPLKAQVKKNGLERHQLLKQRLENIKDNQALQLRLPEPIVDLLKNYPKESLDVLIEGAQMIHGDLNLGNVWLLDHTQNDRQSCVFLDFEDSLSAWFNPMKDLAFVLERFVLTHADKEHEKLALIFLKSYYDNHHHRFNHPEHLTQLLQALSIRALLLLIEVSEKHGSELSQEWKKFQFLYNLATQNKKLLEKIICKAAESA